MRTSTHLNGGHVVGVTFMYGAQAIFEVIGHFVPYRGGCRSRCVGPV
jgi:hypothetical protein